MNSPIQETAILIADALELNSLIALYTINSWWKDFLDTPYVIQKILDKYELVFHGEFPKLGDIVAVMDRKDPSRLCKSETMYECLLKAIETKDNYVFDVLFDVTSYEKNYEQDFNDYFKRNYNRDEFITYLIIYAAKYSNLYVLEQLPKYYEGGDADLINPFGFEYTVGPIDYNKYIDIVVYLAIRFKNVNIVKAYIKGKPIKNSNKPFHGFPIHELVKSDIPDRVLSKILRLILEYNPSDFGTHADEDIEILDTQNKKASLFVLVQALAQYIDRSKTYKINYVEDVYYEFLDFLSDNNVSLIDSINYLETIIRTESENEIKAIHYATISTLNNIEIDKQILDELPTSKDLYFAFRGFFYLCYSNKYTIDHITYLLIQEGASYRAIKMAKKLINMVTDKL
jgi:hypothetical protein